MKFAASMTPAKHIKRRSLKGMARPNDGYLIGIVVEMRQKGYRLTRWADDWVVTCRTRAEAEHALARAGRILETLGVTLNREKTRIVHIAQGFEFLGFKIGRGKGRFKLTRDRIKAKLNRQNLYAIPTQKSVDRFKDQIRAWTMRRIPLRLGELIETINPIIRGWGNYDCRSHVRKRFHQLDGWIIRRLWSHRAKRWRNAAWKEYRRCWPTPCSMKWTTRRWNAGAIASCATPTMRTFTCAAAG